MGFFSPIKAHLQLNALKHAWFRKLDCTKLNCTIKNKDFDPTILVQFLMSVRYRSGNELQKTYKSSAANYKMFSTCSIWGAGTAVFHDILYSAHQGSRESELPK